MMVSLSDLQGLIASLDADFPKNAVARLDMSIPTQDFVLSRIPHLQRLSGGDVQFKGRSFAGIDIYEDATLKRGTIKAYNSRGEYLYTFQIEE
jgi:hypothetical protein